MSGTSIPMSAVPFNPFTGGRDLLANSATEAGIGQTQAQTGLIGAQTRAADINNQIAGARLPFLMQAYGGIGSGPSAAPGSGPPGAIGASGGQDWTGPGGMIMDQNGPFGQLGAIPKGTATNLMLAPPEKWAELVPSVRQQKNQYVSQAIAETLDPTTGQADPAKWNQMVSNEVQQGWMTASQARGLWNHPEMAQTILNSTLAVGEQPGTKAAQTEAVQSTEARYGLVKTTVSSPDGTTQEVWVPKSSLVGGAASAPAGGGGRTGRSGQGGGVLPAALTTEIGKASKAYDVPADDLSAMAWIESKGSSAATSPTGPTGAMQFTGDTAARVGITNPRDPRQAAFGGARYWRENQAELTDSLGHQPTAAQTYLAHQQGAAGAAALIQAPADMLAVDALKQAGIPPRNVLVNGGTPTMTAGQFVNKWQKNWDDAKAATAGGTPSGAQVAGPGAPTAANPAGFVAPTPEPGAPGVAAAGPVELSPQMKRLAEIDSPQIKEDAAANTANLTGALNANKAGTNMRVLRDLAVGAPTGAMADQRVAAQSMATQFGGPLAQRIVGALTGVDKNSLSKMEEINKLALNNVVSQEQAVGPGTRIGAMFTNFFAKASPNINMQEPAIREILNMGLVAQQMAKDYATASNEFYNSSRDATASSLEGGKYVRYQPLSKLEGQWTADKSIHGPETYAAASNLLNGTVPSKAFKGLTNEQQVEALKIIQRADPTSMDAVIAMRGK